MNDFDEHNQLCDLFEDAKTWLIDWHYKNFANTHYADYIKKELAGDFAHDLLWAIKNLEKKASHDH